MYKSTIVLDFDYAYILSFMVLASIIKDNRHENRRSIKREQKSNFSNNMLII